MELMLTHQTDTQIGIICDNQLSHVFDLQNLAFKIEKKFLDDPLYYSKEFDAVLIAYGKILYQALFPPNTTAQSALAATLNTPDESNHLLLVTTDNDLDAIPWEYTYGPDDFLVLECPFMRGLPANQRIAHPTLGGELHIVAVPSSPLSDKLEPLNIDVEWLHLKEIIQEVRNAITLERTRPSSIGRLRELVANQKQSIVHFMGHGLQKNQETFLCFEQDNGDLDEVTAKRFVQRLQGHVFLVTLNACVSAAPGATQFGNLASALARWKTPYALGMHLKIVDEDARAFSSTFYSELAHGSPVEKALFQARLTLDDKNRSSRRWAIGVPVLYTALSPSNAGFPSTAGTPTIEEHQPLIDSNALPRAEGIFQGRIDELKQLGTYLTQSRPRIVTIHGGGGQGKTALAREAVERFAYAWPGGIWSISLENLPSRATFVTRLARFLGILPQEFSDGQAPPAPLPKRVSGLLSTTQGLLEAKVPNLPQDQKSLDPKEVERQVLASLGLRRTLIVLDNAETLVDKAEAGDADALDLVECIRQLPSLSVSLLVTSRRVLEWSGEVSLELAGLSKEEGAKLFQQYVPQRPEAVEHALAEQLSEMVDGHPLSLRLLGGAFNASAMLLQAFVKECETRLIEAEDKYVSEKDRHRKLYACIDTSIRSLDTHLRALLSGLWIFHAPFPPETAVAIFDPDAENSVSPVRDYLHGFWQRGLLTYRTETVRDGIVEFYHMLPTTRPYVEHYMEQAYEPEMLRTRFGAVYFTLASFLLQALDSSAIAFISAQQTREDLEQGIECVKDLDRGAYRLYYGWILCRLGDPLRGRVFLEKALENAQGQDRELELVACVFLGRVYQDIGQPQQALSLFNEALPITHEVGDRAMEATILNNMGLVYQATGQPQLALQKFQEALPIMGEVGNRAGEGAILNGMGMLYRDIGQLQQALELFEQARPIMDEVGNRAGEATILSNMGLVYQAIGQPQQALQKFQEALPITREVSNRAMEATILNNIGMAYQTAGQLQQALELFEQALPISREVGDRAMEATTLNNMGMLYLTTEQPQQALELFEQALPIMDEVGNLAMKSTTRSNIAMLLYMHFNRQQEAITFMEEAIAILVEAGLPQDAAGQKLDDLQSILQVMQSGVPLGGQAMLSPVELQEIIDSTIQVMTTGQDQHSEWREAIAEALQNAQQQGANWQIEVDFFNAVLALLDGQSPTLPADHPYAQAIKAIQDGIVKDRQQP